MKFSNKVQSLVNRLVPRAQQPIRCAIYARSATPNRLGIARQIKACRAYARRMGWKVVEGLVLVDQGMSGNSADGRDALQALLALTKVNPRPFDALICEDSARLARDLGIATEILEAFGQCGVEVRNADGMHLQNSLPLDPESHA